jgi:uncharacterized delta-60 repeat protein
MTLAVSVLPRAAAAGEGSLDLSFGVQGKTTTDFGGAPDSARSVLVQPDGKILVGGLADPGRFGLVRYTPDGSLDPSFGVDGVVTTEFGEYASLSGLGLHSDGRIAAVGEVMNGSEGYFGVALYTPDGSLDTSFGGDGTVTTDFMSNGQDRGLAAMVQPDGKIVAVGSNGAFGGFALARYELDGSLDPAFGTGGTVVTGQGAANAALLQPDGKIVAVGSSDPVTWGSWVLTRYQPDGSLDSSFGANGSVITDFGTYPAAAYGVAIDDTGRLLVVGEPDVAAGTVLIRYQSDGSIDTTFGNSGIASSALSPTAIAVQHDGKIVIAGATETDGDWDFALSRFESDGSLDTNFGTVGLVMTDFGSPYESANALTVQSDGKLVAAGKSGDFFSTQDFAVARYVTTANSNPYAVDDGPYDASEDEVLEIEAPGVLENDTDPDGDSLFAVQATDALYGTVLLNDDGSFTYTPELRFSGEDSFTYRAEDPDGLTSGEATVTVVVRAANSAPVAFDDTYILTSGDTLNIAAPGVLGNDTDLEGGVPGTARKQSDPSHGTLTLNANGAFSYEHDGSAAASDSFTYRAEDSSGELSNPATVTLTVEKPPPPPEPPPPPPPEPSESTFHTVGLVDPATGEWHLRNQAGAVTSFFYGNPGDVPFVGDWDGDGVATPGLFRTSDAFAYLRNSNTQGIADIRFFFGNPSDVPLAGDWDGDGDDTLSIYRPSEQRFYIINQLGENNGGLGAADYSFLFGNPGDKPVVGDWDGDGIDEIGLHRESTGFFYWRNTLDTGVADGEIFFGDPGDRFVAGDWGQVDGADTPGLFRPSDVTFYFRHTLTQGTADSQFTWTGAGTNWLPVAG